MNITKALEILDLEISCDFDGNEQDRQDAVKLGIEALREVRKSRMGGPLLDGELLPGETEEF